MHEIKLLDNITINKIAAGEVVERPSSVVKELMENAIDAGATQLLVEIKDGGTTYIKITDNGSGIPRDQVKTAFIRHATSKIENVTDLEVCMTLGFRGEALPSIASVSQIQMTTKTEQAETGTSIEISGGNILSFEEIGAAKGTTIVVQNLFYNIPARKKFLKKPAAESAYVTDAIYKIALAHPEVSIQYKNNQSQLLLTQGTNDLKSVIFNIYGKETAQKLIPLDSKKGLIRLHGFLGKPEIARANRTYGSLFINGRYIKSDLFYKAVEECYKTRLPVGKFPVFILNMEIAGDQIDVNVHPAKLEVRFHDEDGIYDLVCEAVNHCLSAENLIPEAKWDKMNEPVAENPVSQIIYEVHEVKPKQEALANGSDNRYSNPASREIYKWEKPDPKVPTLKEDLTPYTAPARPSAPLRPVYPTPQPVPVYLQSEIEDKAIEKAFHHYKIIGQVFATYWIVEQDNVLYVIDQHAAHERVLYEELLAKAKEKTWNTQKLLEPYRISITEPEKALLLEQQDFFTDFGFELEVNEDMTCHITGIPDILESMMNQDFFTDLLDLLKEQRVHVTDALFERLAQMACKAAIKGNDEKNPKEAEHLITRLLALENPFTCPHGRPTIIEMSKYEIEKKFKRV